MFFESRAFGSHRLPFHITTYVQQRFRLVNAVLFDLGKSAVLVSISGSLASLPFFMFFFGVSLALFCSSFAYYMSVMVYDWDGMANSVGVPLLFGDK